uniref:Exosome complex component MTR3-like n=1 Tax=Phallusia mammillata TaxID=59560 RepID=A0A6F9DCV1_9ASCI|nr:exosome complex component MTR3-like [Phallusia mammillata]
MATDSRRLAVPQSSLDPKSLCPAKVERLLNDEEQRLDGRYSSESRGIYLQCGTVSQAKGSCYCELGNTKVVCSVYGPKDVEHYEDFQMEGKIKCEFKYAPFSCSKHRGHIPDLSEAEISDVILQALTASVRLQCYPKSLIEVFIIVLENDGSAVSASITAASLALADAGIEQYDIVTSASVRVYGNGNFLEDPTSVEEYRPQDFDSESGGDLNHGLVTVALLPTLNQVCAVLSNGHLECDVLVETIQMCTSLAQNLYTAARKCLLSSVKSVDQNNA